MQYTTVGLIRCRPTQNFTLKFTLKSLPFCSSDDLGFSHHLHLEKFLISESLPTLNRDRSKSLIPRHSYEDKRPKSTFQLIILTWPSHHCNGQAWVPWHDRKKVKAVCSRNIGYIWIPELPYLIFALSST